jgi:predicted Rossmann fold flavoprotein
MADIAIVGAGAAGLATAISAARRDPNRSIVVLDGAAKVGAKILVAGGGRCNVTNAVVTPDDFNGGSRSAIRRVLSAFPVERTVAFFREIGAPLHEEEHGKLFPDTNRARTVLDALLNETNRRGVRILAGRRVLSIERRNGQFELTCSSGTAMAAGKVVLATGGLSLPKTGSDGAGYQFARQLGHSLVPTTPALVPLILDGGFHAPLSGIAEEAEITVRVEGRKPARLRGSMLWTHFGVSGPVVLDVSRTWHRARLEGLRVTVSANLLPGYDFASAEQRLIALASSQPRTQLDHAVATLLPARVATAILDRLAISGQIAMAHLAREDRRRLVGALLAWPLPVRDSRGYPYAEVTAGGVPLDEIDPNTLASRKCPGLHLVGEILDVDGRIGGFNFQWAWSSGWVAGASA